MTPKLGGKRAERKNLESVMPLRARRTISDVWRDEWERARWVYALRPKGFLDDKPDGSLIARTATIRQPAAVTGR